jgi:hypothetical protein
MQSVIREEEEGEIISVEGVGGVMTAEAMLPVVMAWLL